MISPYLPPSSSPLKDLLRIFSSIGCVSKLTTTVNIAETGIANIITSIVYHGMVLISISTPKMNLQIPSPVAVFLNTNTSKNKLVNVPDKSPAIAPSFVARFQNNAAQ